MRYSDYTMEQLQEELGRLKEELQTAEQFGEVQNVMILERKMQMVASYMLYPDDFKPGEIYTLRSDPGFTFKIDYVDGVMAWGNRINLLGEMEEKASALPISILEEKQKD